MVLKNHLLSTNVSGSLNVFLFITTEITQDSVVSVVLLLSHVQLCDPMDFSLPGSSVHGISQARIWKWVAVSFSRGSSQPTNQTRVSCTGSRILYRWATREAQVQSFTFLPTVCKFPFSLLSCQCLLSLYFFI